MHETEERELLKQWRPWLTKVAAGMCQRFPDRLDDMRQEGWIAVWKAANEDRTGRTVPLDYWIKRCALNRMKQVYNMWTAQCRDARRTDLLDSVAMWNTSDTADEHLWAHFDTDLMAVLEAYHNGDIARAVNELPYRQRQYVIRKFWHNWSPTALDIYFDSARNTWRAAKINLKKELAHLGAE